MRTKTLLCSALLAAAVATSAVAQSNVYSLNVVGYYNVVSPAGGLQMVANQLHTTNDVLSNILPGPYPDGTIFYFYNNGFTVSAWDTDNSPPSWDVDFFIPPGRGGFLRAPANTTFTFVGEVSQGSLTNVLPHGRTLRAPVPPVQLTVSQMNLPGEDGDVIFNFRGGYNADTWDTDNTPPFWDIDFTNHIGESFFYFKGTGTSTNWVYNFTVQ